jgi:hypothetical protein
MPQVKCICLMLQNTRLYIRSTGHRAMTGQGRTGQSLVARLAAVEAAFGSDDTGGRRSAAFFALGLAAAGAIGAIAVAVLFMMRPLPVAAVEPAGHRAEATRGDSAFATADVRRLWWKLPPSANASATARMRQATLPRR